jgi:parvulin-like peptidyl-prolyl isomerase
MLCPVYSRKAFISAVSVLALSLQTACSAPWPWRRNPGAAAANNARLAKPDPQGLAGADSAPGVVIEEGQAEPPPGTNYAGQQANEFNPLGSGGDPNAQTAALWNGPPNRSSDGSSDGSSVGSPDGAPVGAPVNAPVNAPVGSGNVGPTGTVPGSSASPESPALGLPPGDMLPGQAFAPAQTIAIIGDQYVLAGEIEGAVNLILAISLPVETPPEKIVNPGPELATQKEGLFKQQLQGEVQAKIGYVDFLRNVPPERVPDLQKRIGESFAKELDGLREKARKAEADDLEELRRRDPILLRVALFMNQRQLETLGDLDLRLRAYGTTLERQQRAYGEQKLSQMAVMRNIRRDAEISHAEMLDHYQRNREQYLVPAKARWEQLSVRFDKFSAERDAYAALAAMGNEVYLGGAALSAVAKRSSQEPEADNGGQHDWTNRGSLASKPLDEAIFSLPLDRLSEIIRDDRGLHIVRVLERTEESYTPFLEAQVEIKEKIRTERRTAEIMAYLEKLRGNIRVWTIYDGEQGTAAESETAPGGTPAFNGNGSP